MNEMPFEQVDPAIIKRRLDAGERLHILDVREEPEWEMCRIEGAEFRPLSEIQEWASQIDPEGGPYVLYCHHGMRSAQACMFLASEGVKDLINLAGGIHGWSMNVDPSVPMYR